jgi:hypothetical protein
VLVAHVGVPDSALGIDADPVWVVAGRLRPHAPATEPAVAAGIMSDTARQSLARRPRSRGQPRTAQ